MRAKEFVEGIRNLIAKAELDKAIELFLEFSDEFKDEIIIHSFRYNHLLKDARKGLITQEELEVKRAKICSALLEVLNEVDASITPKKNYYLTEELEEILALAEYQSRKDNRPVTSTRYFFSALTKLRPGMLLPIIESLEEKEALPHDIDDETLEIPRELSNSRQFSNCVASSLNELVESSSEDNPIDVEDLFIDVAKYGTGPSVKMLREKGVSMEKIDALVKANNLNIMNRK